MANLLVSAARAFGRAAARSPVEEHGKTIWGWHFSNSDDALRRLDPEQFATGASKRSGAERMRLEAAENQDIKPRTYFYAEGARSQPGKRTPRPEGVVGGGGTYRAKLDKIYDLNDNPLGFKGDASEIERQIKQSGFNGYVRNDVVVDFYPVEASRVGEYRAKAEEALQRFERLPEEPEIVTAEVIPSPQTEMGRRLLDMPMSARERYTDEFVTRAGLDKAMKEMGIDDYFIDPGYGTYKGDVNPNLIISTGNPEDAKRVADAVGYSAQQEAVPFINRTGTGPTGVMVQTRGGGKPSLLEDLYRKTGLDASRTDLDKIDIINFDGLPDEEFIDKVVNFIRRIDGEGSKYRAGGEYNVTQELWQRGDGLAGLPAGDVETITQLRKRVEEYNRRFQKQHGYADPRALASMAALTGIIAAGGQTEAQEMTREQRQAVAKAKARLRLQQTQQGDPNRIPEPFARKGANVSREQAARAPQQLAEAAGTANEAFMWVPDTAVKAANLIPGVNLPTPSEAIESATGVRPGPGYLPPGPERELYRAAGNTIPFMMGATSVEGRNLGQKIGDAAAEVLGFGSAAPATIGGQVLPDSPRMPAVSEASDRARREVAVKSGSGSLPAAGFKLDDVGRVVPDELQRKAIRAGVDEGVVSYMAAAPRSSRSRMRRMLDYVDKGLENYVEKHRNRPADVIGDAVSERVQVLADEARKWGKEVKRTAKSLQSEQVDFSPAVNDFIAVLDDAGVAIDPNTGKVNFMGSVFEGRADGMRKAQKIIEDTVRRMRFTAKNPNAWDTHRLKKWIDNQVTYGSEKPEAVGQAERIIKRLRRNIDSALDQAFPAYNEANTRFKEVHDPLEELQSLAGRRVDIEGDNASRALGVLSRKVLSNYASGAPLDKTLKDIDRLAREYNPSLPDADLDRLITFASNLDTMFGAGALNTFQGRIEAANIATSARDPRGAASRYAAEKLSEVLSTTNKDKLRAMRELLSD